MFHTISHVSYGGNETGIELLYRGDPLDYGIQSH